MHQIGTLSTSYGIIHYLIPGNYSQTKKITAYECHSSFTRTVSNAWSQTKGALLSTNLQISMSYKEKKMLPIY